MAYRIAKEIAGQSAVLFGQIDAIILTGGLAYSDRLTRAIEERIAHLGQSYVVLVKMSCRRSQKECCVSYVGKKKLRNMEANQHG